MSVHSRRRRSRFVESLEDRLLFHAEPGTGLKADYFDSATFSNYKFTRTDATVNFNWGTGSPDATKIAPDTFTVRWTGQVEPAYSQTYTFYAQVNDGVRLWVNNTLLISQFHTNTNAVEYKQTIALKAGQHYNIKMEYLEQTGSASAKLSWSSASTPKQIVPKARLFPTYQTPPPPAPPPPVSGGVSSLWKPVAGLPTARHEGAAAVVNGRLLAIGGYLGTSLDATKRVDAYNPATNTWSRLADMPEALTHSGAAVDGSTVWIVGGFVGNNPGPSTSRVWKYNASTNQWSAGPALPQARAGGGLVKVGRELHYFGGYGVGNLYNAPDKADHYVLKLDGGTSWTTAPALPVARNHMAGVEFQGKIYAIGGQTGGGDGEKYHNRADVNIYNPATKTWSNAPSLPYGRGHINASTFVHNGRIVVAGGVANGPMPMDDVVAFDPSVNAWVALPDLPGARQAGMAGVIGDTIYFTGGETGIARSQTSTWSLSLKGNWELGPQLPVALAETAAGIIGNKLYVIGEGSSGTFAYDLSKGTWQSNLAPRPHVGDHHAAEVFNGKLYLFGGFNGGSSGKVQIYDPTTNKWSLGATMPFAPGSASTARIGNFVYVAGGITGFVPNVGGTTTTQAAKYNLLTNTWSPIASMPRGVHHAAASTDGSRFFIFGGRAGKGGVEDGFNTVQIYNPATNTWTSSDTSSIAKLPQARGGMGKAVFAGGEFYVIGGETKTGAGANANRTYNRVDIYNPATNKWRLGKPMTHARHGIFPVLYAGRIYVAAGGTVAGASKSTLFEIFNV